MLANLTNYNYKKTDFLAAQKILQRRFNVFTHNEMLEGVLLEIEQNLKGYVNDDVLADKFSLSRGHLCRLFRIAFGCSLGAYIRARRLEASIEDLVYSDMNIVDIAIDYGFDYEQSYIRAFKREFGITPGGFRKEWQMEKTDDQICSSKTA